jgi:hypothetical protein
MHRPVLLALLMLTAACSNAVQYTSGEAFVEARDASGLRPIDADIAKVASVEPNLSLPARIGVARIVNGALTLPSPAEGELLADLGTRHAALGEFVQVSPLVAAMVTGSDSTPLPRPHSTRKPENVIHDIRLAAARQHLDYVLVYELGAKSRERDTIFALADVTLIGGAFLPTRSYKVAGVAQAIFLDVRTGYPYGTAQAATDLSALGRSFGSHRREDKLQEKATDKVFTELVPEVEAMFRKLLEARPKGD